MTLDRNKSKAGYHCSRIDGALIKNGLAGSKEEKGYKRLPMLYNLAMPLVSDEIKTNHRSSVWVQTNRLGFRFNFRLDGT
jgi:hypothetical protein